jgi:hypothetical protein
MSKNDTIPVDVFAIIGLSINDPATYGAFSLVCQSASEACKRIKVIKQWHFETVLICYDGQKWFQLNGKNKYALKDEVFHDRPTAALYAENEFTEKLVFKMRLSELIQKRLVKTT